MSTTRAPSGGALVGRVWIAVLSLVFATTTLAVAPVAAVEPAPGGPQQPSPDELASVAAAALLDAGSIEQLPDLVAAAGAILDYAWSLPGEDWDVELLAAELDYDPMVAFEFVRDHVRYEPYAGILRGAEGALAARAGNSLDRSLLLAALLDEMLVDYEFVVAELEDAALGQVMDAARQAPPVSLDEESPGARLDSTDISDRARRDYAMLRGALAPHLSLDGGLDEAAAEADARTHAWLRMPFGAETLDLDTTVADAQPGDALADPDQAFRTFPDEFRHTVQLQLILEELELGDLSERVVLDERLDAVDAARRELFLFFEPDLDGFAGAINAVLSGDERWSPVLMRDGERIMGDSFSAGGSGQDLLGDATELPEPVSMRLVATAEGPGLAPSEATHMLFDRRVSRGLAGSQALDAPIDPLESVAGIPIVLTGIANIVVSTGGLNPRTFAYRHAQVLDFIDAALLEEDTAGQYVLADRLWPMAMSGQAMALTSEQVLVPAAGGADGHGFVARPRVYLTSIGPEAGDLEAVVEITDLMLDSVRVLPSVSGAPTAPAHLWYGALQSALETEQGLRAERVQGDESALTSASLSLRQPLNVIGPGIGTAPGSAPAALLDDLASGALVVLAGDGSAPDSWWSVAGASGVTHAMLAPGLRGVRDVIEPNAAQSRVYDEIYRKSERGSKSKARKWRPPGGTQRSDGYDRRQYKQPRKPGLPRGEKLKLPKSKPPPLRQPSVPRCTGQGEYMTVVGCVSLPTAGAFYLLGAVYGVSITGITYGLLKIWLE
jgi:hypothetical protein